MTLPSAPWVEPAARSLIDPVAEELRRLPAWLADEPEWELVGMIHNDVLRTARRRCAAEYGIHAYVRIVHASILDPSLIEPYTPNDVLKQATGPRAPFFGAVYLQRDRRISDLWLMLEFLSRYPGLQAEDLYDMIGLWGAVDERVARLLDACRTGGTHIAVTAMRALSAAGFRGFVDPRMGQLEDVVTQRDVPELTEVFFNAFRSAWQA